jgi:hypothetical protein
LGLPDAVDARSQALDVGFGLGERVLARRRAEHGAARNLPPAAEGRRPAYEDPIQDRNHDIRAVRLAENRPEVLISMLRVLRKKRSVQLEDLADLKRWNIELVKEPITVLYDTFTLIHGEKVSLGAPKANLQTYGAGTLGHSTEWRPYAGDARQASVVDRKRLHADGEQYRVPTARLARGLVPRTH